MTSGHFAEIESLHEEIKVRLGSSDELVEGLKC